MLITYFQTVAVPSGSGKILGYTTSAIQTRKASTILVQRDHLCLIRSVIVGIAFCEWNSQQGNQQLYRRYRDLSRLLSNEQTEAALDLLRECNIPTNLEFYTLHHMHLLQMHFMNIYYFVVLGKSALTLYVVKKVVHNSLTLREKAHTIPLR
jgi:hypothetical protein